MFSTVGTRVKKSISVCSVGRTVGRFIFYFLFILDSVRVRENFDFQLIGGEDWRRIRSESDAEARGPLTGRYCSTYSPIQFVQSLYVLCVFPLKSINQLQ